MLNKKSLANIKNAVLLTWFNALIINASDSGKNSYFKVGYHTCLYSFGKFY